MVVLWKVKLTGPAGCILVTEQLGQALDLFHSVRQQCLLFRFWFWVGFFLQIIYHKMRPLGHAGCILVTEWTVGASPRTCSSHATVIYFFFFLIIGFFLLQLITRWGKLFQLDAFLWLKSWGQALKLVHSMWKQYSFWFVFL